MFLGREWPRDGLQRVTKGIETTLRFLTGINRTEVKNYMDYYRWIEEVI